METAMRQTFVSLLLAAGLVSSAGASDISEARGRASESHNVYKIDLDVGRGDRVENAKMSLLPGKPARFSVEYTDGSAPGLRVQVLATPGVAKSTSAVRTVRLQFMLLEKIGNAWVLIGEPEISAFEGRTATMEYESDAGPVNLKVLAVSAYSANASAKSPAACPSIYSVETPKQASSAKSDLRASTLGWPPSENCPQLPCPGPSAPGCCSMYCERPNTTMTCCGADECCGTGCGCCTPGLG